MSSLKRHSAIYLAGRVGPALVNLLATAVYTRLAVPSEYAYLVLANSIAQVGSAALFQWLRMSLLRLAPDVAPERMLGTMGVLYSVQAVVAVSIGAAAYPLMESLPGGWIFWLCTLAMVLAQAWFDLAQELQRSALKPANYSLTFATRSVMGLILGTVALWLTGSGILLVASVTISLLFSPLFFNGGVFKLKPLFDAALAKRILGYGWPLGIAVLLASVTTMGDRLFIAAFMGAEAAGIYGPAGDLAKQTVFVLAQSVSLAGYPLALRAFRDRGRDAALSQMKDNFELTLFIAMGSAVGLAAMSEEASYVLFGAEYRDVASTLLPIISVGAFAMSIRMFYFDQAMQLGEKTHGQLVVGVVLVACSLSLYFLLIPTMGLKGAAVAGVVAQVAGLLVSLLIGRRCFRLPVPTASVLRTSGACAVMYGCCRLASLAFDGMGHTRVAAVAVVGISSLLLASVLLRVPALAVLKKKSISRRG